MRSFAGKLIEAAFAMGFLGLFLYSRWEEFARTNPHATAWDFAVSLAPFFGAIVVGITIVAALAGLLALGGVKPKAQGWACRMGRAPYPPDTATGAGVTLPLSVITPAA